MGVGCGPIQVTGVWFGTREVKGVGSGAECVNEMLGAGQD